MSTLTHASAEPGLGGYFFVAGLVGGVERTIHPSQFASAAAAVAELRALFGEELRGLPVQGPFPSLRAAWNAFDTATAR